MLAFALLQRHYKTFFEEKRIKELRINGQIRSPKVLVVTLEGEQLGEITIAAALQIADERGLDLVEVAPDHNPSVCRIMNYGKFRFEQQKKEREVKKKQKVITVKEMKLRPKIDKHDYETKLGHVRRFLSHGDKVKVTIMFRGREMAHMETGTKLLTRIIADLSNDAVMEQRSKLEENNLIVLFGPKQGKEEKSAKT